MPPTDADLECKLLSGQYPWRFEVCRDCGAKNIVGFRTCNYVWKAVMGDDEGLVLCISCFDRRAAAKGIDWTEEPVEWNPVSTVANAKWQHVKSLAPDNLEAALRELREGLGQCYRLFLAVRLDWSDPKAECNEGMAIVQSLLGEEECRRLAEAVGED